MALCLAHAAAGYLAYEALRPPGWHRPRLLVTAVLVANAPDLDFLPGLVAGDPTAFHRGVTHTMAAAALVGVAAWCWARARRPERADRVAAIVGVAYSSHLLLDWMTVDAVLPAGIRLLWPVSHVWSHAPWSLLGEIIVDSTSRGGFVRSLFTAVAVETWAREVGVFLATVGLAQLARRAYSGLRDLAATAESLEEQGDAS